MIKRILGIGAGVAVVGVVGVLGYLHFVPAGPAAATASPTSSTSKIITLGSEAETPVAAGRVKIAPVTPRQMPPKMSDLKPKPAATQPAAADPAAPKTGAAAQPPKTAATTGAPSSSGAQPQIIKPVKPAVKAQLAQPRVPTTQPRAATSQPTVPTTQPKTSTKRKTISIQGDGTSGASGEKLSPSERASISLLHQLHSLRSSIGLWKLRHEGQEVDFVANSGWEQLTRRDQMGQVLGSVPVNPYNGCSRVLAVRDDPRPGQAVVGPFGYVYSTGSGKLWATDSNGRIFDDAAIDAVGLEVRAVRELSPQDAQRYLLAGLNAMRSQITLFALQHGDRTPDFNRYPAFEQLLKPTLADGRVVEGAGPGRSGQMYGPYILSMPVNALNGRYKVKVMDGEVKPGQKIDWNEAGFVFSTANRRLYAVDADGCVYDDARNGAAGVPRESGGSSQAPAADPAQTLRSQVALYKLQHNDKLPDLKKYPRWEQLTSKTGVDGVPDANGQYGPYLFQTPVNTATGSSQVAVVRSVSSYKANPSVGFVYESSTGRVWLTNPEGTIRQDE